MKNEKSPSCSRGLLMGLAVILTMLASCNLPAADPDAPDLPEQSPPSKLCGDGVCDGPENRENCPQDCAAQDGQEPLPPASDASPVVYLGIMVHLEGWEDDEDQAKFEKHVRLIREYADLFESHGAKLTLESKEVTDGIIKWGDNVLLEMEERGHGIGVHADIGGQLTMDCDQMAADLRLERVQLETLGVNVRHVSGNTSHCDWVQATIDAGYVFTTGQVAYSVMSMPIEDRPLEYRDCETPSKCHDTFPSDLADRLHPWRSSDGADWLTHDPEGELVILSSSQVLRCMEEELQGGVTGSGCTLTLNDIDLFEGELDKAIALAEPGQVNVYYVGWSLGGALDEDLLENWLQRVDAYVERGEVEWMTLPEMYDVYVQWEQGG